MDFDIVNRNSSEVTVRRRKKREKENKKSIFEIYRSEKKVKKMLEAVDNKVIYLKRISFGKLKLDDMELGEVREVNIEDII